MILMHCSLLNAAKLHVSQLRRDLWSGQCICAQPDHAPNIRFSKIRLVFEGRVLKEMLVCVDLKVSVLSIKLMQRYSIYKISKSLQYFYTRVINLGFNVLLFERKRVAHESYTGHSKLHQRLREVFKFQIKLQAETYNFL